MQDFSNLLVRKGIVSKHFETTRMVRSSIGDKLSPEGTIKLSQFQKLFSKAFLRGALMNIFYYLE